MKKIFSLIAIAFACHALASPAAAQESMFDRLSIHGYLTQAYGHSQEAIYGIPTQGTTDIRTAALQVRYALSPKDNFVVQARHRRLGDNILSEVEEDIHLQWAFYQRRMGDFSFRVGKVPLPMGFYSEIRNVGTILPFYRAPAVIYPDGTETFDGINANYDLRLGSWGFEAATNFGSFTSVNAFQDEQGNPTATKARADIKYAGTLTVNTPLPGLRVRGTINTFEQASWMDPSRDETTEVRLGSVDGSFTHFNVRGEYGRLLIGESTTIDLAYAQAGVRLHPKVMLNGQYEVSKFKMSMVIPGVGPFSMEQTSIEDLAVGVNYSLSPNVLFRVEGHDAKGFSFDNQPFGSPKRQGKYMVSSVSVSF